MISHQDCTDQRSCVLTLDIGQLDCCYSSNPKYGSHFLYSDIARLSMLCLLTPNHRLLLVRKTICIEIAVHSLSLSAMSLPYWCDQSWTGLKLASGRTKDGEDNKHRDDAHEHMQELGDVDFNEERAGQQQPSYGIQEFHADTLDSH